jgi:hypothetical protein
LPLKFEKLGAEENTRRFRLALEVYLKMGVEDFALNCR